MDELTDGQLCQFLCVRESDGGFDPFTPAIPVSGVNTTRQVRPPKLSSGEVASVNRY